jgi:hypothetical protein
MRDDPRCLGDRKPDQAGAIMPDRCAALPVRDALPADAERRAEAHELRNQDQRRRCSSGRKLHVKAAGRLQEALATGLGPQARDAVRERPSDRSQIELALRREAQHLSSRGGRGGGHRRTPFVASASRMTPCERSTRECQTEIHDEARGRKSRRAPSGCRARGPRRVSRSLALPAMRSGNPARTWVMPQPCRRCVAPNDRAL